YPHATLQRLLDAGEVSERIDIEMLVALARAGLASLDAVDFAALERCGLFLPGTRFAPPTGILAADGQRIEARLDDPATRARIAEHCLACRLSGGHVLHSGFLLGPRGFYAAL